MNEYVLTAIVILLTLGIGFLLLIKFGVSEVAYFGVSIILFTMVGSLVYVWWKTQADKTVDRLKIETIAKIRSDFFSTQRLINEAKPMTPLEEVEKNLKKLQNHLLELKFFGEDLSINEKESNKYTLTSIEQESRRMEQRLKSLQVMAAGSYKSALDNHVLDLKSRLEKLNGGGYSIGKEMDDFSTLSERPVKDLTEMIQKKEVISRKFDEILEISVGKAESLAEVTKDYGDVKAVLKMITEAREKKSDIDKRIALLIGAQNHLKNIVGGEFYKRRDALINAVQNAQDLVKDPCIGRVEELGEKARTLDDPGQLKEVYDLEGEYRVAVVEMVSSFYQDLIKKENKLKEYEFPEAMYSSDPLIEDSVKGVGTNKDFDAFFKEANKTLSQICKQLGNLEVLLKILESYEKVEQLIAKKVNEQGAVKAQELGVKHPDKFLLLYSLKNPGVVYKERVQTLVKTT